MCQISLPELTLNGGTGNSCTWIASGGISTQFPRIPPGSHPFSHGCSAFHCCEKPLRFKEGSPYLLRGYRHFSSWSLSAIRPSALLFLSHAEGETALWWGRRTTRVPFYTPASQFPMTAYMPMPEYLLLACSGWPSIQHVRFGGHLRLKLWPSQFINLIKRLFDTEVSIL